MASRSYPAKTVKGTAIYNQRGKLMEFIPDGQNTSTQPSQRPSQSPGQTPSQSPGPKPSQARRNPPKIPQLEQKFNQALFDKKIENVMRDNMYTREVDGHRSGKLSNRKLYKIATGNIKLFKRKQERKNKNYNISIVLDVSGSMDTPQCLDVEKHDELRIQIGHEWRKNNPDQEYIQQLEDEQNKTMTSAKRTALFLIDKVMKTFKGNNINVELTAFGEIADTIKPFNQDHINEIQESRVHSGGTHLLPALQLAVGNLEKQQGPKVLVVISDGATTNPETCKLILDNLIDIQVVGVELGTPCLHELIPDRIRIDTPSEFITKFPAKLSEKVKRA